MKLRLFALAFLLVACTRSVSDVPLATPPVTVVAEATTEGQAAQPTQAASVATKAPTATALPVTNRLPKGINSGEPLPAGAGSWSIWRRGTDAGVLFRADAAGQVQQANLPATEGLRPSPEFALAPDGQIIVYTLLDSEGGVTARSLAAYEFATGRLQTAPLDPDKYNLVDFGTLTAAFSPDGTQVALALEGYPLNDNTTPQFRVFLWDLQTNDLKEEITTDTAISKSLLPEQHTPLPVRWDPEGVLLVGRLYQSTTYSKTLLWQPDAGSITAAPETSAGFALRGQRLAGSEEVVWPDYNADYPAQPLECWGANSPDNVLNLRDLSDDKTHVIFAAGAGEQIGRARWLEGGSRLALLMVGCDHMASRLVVLDRQGGVNEAAPVSGSVALFADGSDIILLTEDLEANQTTLTTYDGGQNWAPQELASFSGTLGSAGYAFSFISTMQATPSLDPFPEVGAQASISGLEIGRKATVASSSGVLNLRTEPDQDSPALGLLAAGDEVTILDGPVTAPNGLVYWKVQTADNIVGWAVESVEGEQTLIPKP
jgi:hypothetical protein